MEAKIKKAGAAGLKESPEAGEKIKRADASGLKENPEAGEKIKRAVYPGSFDPVTRGHLDVIKRASEIFDKVIIAVSVNINKKSLLTDEEKVMLLKECCRGIDNIEIDSFEGLTADYAEKKHADVIIRGLRAVSDFEYEMQMSQSNNALNPNIHTVFLITKPEYNFISSSTVKEIAQMNGDVSKFVTEPVSKFLRKKLRGRD